ncbi:unnamed protein product, partial [Candidula unifasciata]
ILEGLVFLHQNRIVHRNLSLENVLLTKQGAVKLSEYGVYYITDYGADVSFPIGLPRYLPPEVLCLGPVTVEDDTGHCLQPVSGPKADVWSFGIILLELILGRELWSGLSVREMLMKTIELIKTEMSPVDYLSQDPAVSKKLKGVSKEMLDVLRLCLSVTSSKRAQSEELIQHPLFNKMRETAVKFSDDHLSQRSMQEVYYLWRLAGGDLDTVLRKAGMSRTRTPVNLLP